MSVQKSQIQAHTLGDLFYMQLVAEVSGRLVVWGFRWGLMIFVDGRERGGEGGGTMGSAVQGFA